MDTSKLEVGQEVYAVSGVCFRKGWVVRVTPEGADVQTGVQQIDGTWNAHELMHFDNAGRSYTTDVPPALDGTIMSRMHAVLWELDDIPFAERTALMQNRRYPREEP